MAPILSRRAPRRAPLIGKPALALALSLAPLLALGLAQPAAAQDIGVAAFVENAVSGTPPRGTQRPITLGRKVVQNERVATAADARAQLLFRDETVLTIGTASVVDLDRFVYDPARGAVDVALDLARGVFRFVTGNVNSVAYTLRTPTMLIGIRGTVLDIVVEADGTSWVILRQGAAEIKSVSSGLAQRLDVAGLAVAVSRANPAQPTPPAPPPAAIAAQTEGVAAIAPEADGVPTDVTDIACSGSLDCRNLRGLFLERRPRSGSSSGSSSSQGGPGGAD